MSIKLVMGNEAIALGAIKAGVGVVTGYPGTPSTEVIENIAKYNKNRKIYVEWSVNEKSALEIAAGASYAGARTLVTMKQVGLNVAADPIMSLEYVGINGGMVVFVADDPGPISSQTEQDTRKFAEFSKIPVFDPTSPEEAYDMIQDAYIFSEKYKTPVIFRSTTRICHANASIDVNTEVEPKKATGFIKSPDWVIFPKLSYNAHLKIEERNAALRETLSDCKYNTLSGKGKKGIVTGGVSHAYMKEALKNCNADESEYKLLKIATPFPFPENLALEFLSGLDEVVVYEELDPVIEKELTYICGKHNIKLQINGKLNGYTKSAGENSVDDACSIIEKFIGEKQQETPKYDIPPILPIRPPVLCAGCPHRASFYAVKRAMKGKQCVFAGDIGCYTLGNAAPLNMTDTCLCMGADITIAQGISRVQPDTFCFAFIGDSTFFHTGIAGIVNAVYNQANMVACILDNSTTAMTGQQPNPSTGVNAMGEIANSISIEQVLISLGVIDVQTVDPMNTEKAMGAVKRAADIKGVTAVIFKAPCIAVSAPNEHYYIDDEKCINCRRCINELGCPAIIINNGKVEIDKSLCYGCGVCKGVCPTNAIHQHTV